MSKELDEKRRKRNDIVLKAFSLFINIVWCFFTFKGSTFYGLDGFVHKFSNASLKGFLLGCLYYFLLCWLGGCFFGSVNAVIVEILFALMCAIDAITGKEHKKWEDAFNSFMTFSLLTSIPLFAFVMLIHMIGIANVDWFWLLR